ncbi:MAG: winged helix-turn-helix domain-containing protein [Acidobacteriota bacterium]
METSQGSETRVDPVRIGDWLLHADRGELTDGNSIVRLEPRTCAVLTALAERPGDVWSREALLDRVWGDAFVGEAVLTHSIWDLRRTFGDDAKKPSYIQTVPRRGYRLIAEVSRQIDRSAPAAPLLTMVCVRMDRDDAVPPDGWRGSAAWLERLADCAGRPVDPIEWSPADTRSDETSRDPIPRTVWATFERPIQAVRFALEWQKAYQGIASGSGLGMHFGDVEAMDGPESARSLTACMAQLATGGQIVLSRAAFDLAREAARLRGAADWAWDSATLRWVAHGMFQVEGLERALEIYEVGIEGRSPLRPPDDRSFARRLPGDGVVVGWRPAPGLEVPQRPNWRVERKLGEGGFGEVWLCRQAKLKEPRVFKFCHELDRLRALQREVTLFRLLKESLGDRPDIARLLDWNFDEAPYFLEMEFSEAGSLIDWTQDLGGLSAVPLGVRLELIAQVAEGLAAAHSVGVLHKDVKPANVLVRGLSEGRPGACLTDFGIGRLTDRHRLAEAAVTALGFSASESTEATTVGTRLYMAPEVLEGRAASTQADLYSLGVVLYQMLVGDFSRALAPGWRRELEEALRLLLAASGAGSDLSEERALLIEDVADCVEGSPERRLPSAAVLARRLRSLDARAERRRSEARELAVTEARRVDLERSRRRRKVWTSIAVALLAVLALVSAFAVQTASARHAADEDRRRTEGLIGFMLGDLRSTLAGVGRLDAMAATNERVLQHYASIEPTTMADESLVHRVTALHQIGAVRVELGDLAAAAETFERGRVLATTLASRGFVPAHQALLADSHYWLGSVATQNGRLDEASAAFTRHRDLYAELVRRDPTSADARLELAYGWSNLGLVRQRQGRADEALEHFRRCLEGLEVLASERPDDRALQVELAASHHQIGTALESRGQLAGALAAYRDNLHTVRRLAAEASADGPLSAQLRLRRATAEAFTGRLMLRLGDLEGALAAFQREEAEFADLAMLDPENARWQRHLAVARGRLAQALFWRDGPSRGASDRLDRAIEALRSMVARDPAQADWRRDLARLLGARAELQLSTGDDRAALEALEQARDLLISDVFPISDAAEGDDRRRQLLLASIELIRARALGLATSERGTVEAQTALGRLEPLAASSRDPATLALWAQALLAVDRRGEALAVIDQLAAQGYREPSYRAACERHGIFGDELLAANGQIGGSSIIRGSQ